MKKQEEAELWGERKAGFQRDVEESMKLMLLAFKQWTGLETKGPNFVETAARIARAYGEIFEGLFVNGDQVKEILGRTFPAKSEEMVAVGPVQLWSMCPHHFLPVNLRVWVAYIPRKKVLGLSKLARLAELIAKKPALQEDTTAEIAEALQVGVQPKGVGVVIRGRHLCMEMRGVKKNAVTTTTALQGIFYEPEVRAEFLAAVRGER